MFFKNFDINTGEWEYHRSSSIERQLQIIIS